MRDGAEGDFAEFYSATWPRTLAVVYALTGDRGAAEEDGAARGPAAATRLRRHRLTARRVATWRTQAAGWS